MFIYLVTVGAAYRLWQGQRSVRDNLTAHVPGGSLPCMDIVADEVGTGSRQGGVTADATDKSEKPVAKSVKKGKNGDQRC